MSRGGPDPERLLLGRLMSTSRRLAEDGGRIDDAFVRIREAAAGRDDLLVQGAGLGLGAWSVNPGLPVDVLGAALLVNSVTRLELDVLGHWIQTGQQRGLSGARHHA